MSELWTPPGLSDNALHCHRIGVIACIPMLVSFAILSFSRLFGPRLPVFLAAALIVIMVASLAVFVYCMMAREIA